MGRQRRDTPSRELVRLAWLIQQLDDLGIGQTAVAEQTGVKLSYLNQLKNYDRYGKTGLGTETLRQVMNGLRLSPSYFFDDYEGQQDHRLHLLSAKRDEKRVAALEHAAEDSAKDRADQGVKLAKLEARLTSMESDLRKLVDALEHGGRRKRA